MNETALLKEFSKLANENKKLVWKHGMTLKEAAKYKKNDARMDEIHDLLFPLGK